MLSRRLAVAWLTALALTTAILPADAPAAPERRPLVIFLHGGGFVFEDESRMAVATELADELGFEVSYLDYPLFDMPGAIAAAQRRARELGGGERTVVAYGESAGGTLAALLAQRGLVDAAATYSPVPDMRAFPAHTADPEQYVEFIQAGPRDLRQASPMLFSSPVPVLAMRSRRESRFMVRGTRKWAARDPLVELVRVPGVHSGTGQPALYASNVTAALRWLLHTR